MPKQKNVTNADINALLESVGENAENASDFASRIANGYVDELEGADEAVGQLISDARYLLELATRLKTRHDIRVLKEKTKAMIRANI